MYIDLEELKLFLWITTTDQDDKLAQILNLSRWVVVSSLWDFLEWEREFVFNLCDGRWLELNFNTINITEIVKINSKTFDTPEKDFMILPPLDSRVYIKDLSRYLEWVTKYFKVLVKSWFAEADLPQDLKTLQLQICSLFYGTSKWQRLKSYTLWPRSFTFADNSETEALVSSISNIIARYTPLVRI